MNEKSIARVAGPAPWAARFRPNSIKRSRVMSLRFTRPREVLSALKHHGLRSSNWLTDLSEIVEMQRDQIIEKMRGGG